MMIEDGADLNVRKKDIMTRKVIKKCS